MPDRLVRFVMSGGGDKSPSQDERWQRICNDITGVSFVSKTTTMGTYEGEFRVEHENALWTLRREGEVTIVQE